MYKVLVLVNSEVLIEESLLGWKEFEMEVMRDKKGDSVIVCSIENFDPMGVHTGDSQSKNQKKIYYIGLEEILHTKNVLIKCF